MSAEIERIPFVPPARPSGVPSAPEIPAPPAVELSLDGRPVSVPAGSTILDACRSEGIDVPTLCFLETLTPVNACRVCVVEVAGSRVLAPACSRRVEPGMEVLSRVGAGPPQPPPRARAPRLVGRPLDGPRAWPR